MKRVVITGANGRIGTALQKHLTAVDLVALDLPEFDIRKPHVLDEQLDGTDVVVHLAHDGDETFRSDTFSADNARMVANVYAAALRHRVRVIMASSVHADHCTRQASLLTTQTLPTPDSPYGANKVLAEALGRHYATRSLEVVAIRFGGVNEKDAPPRDELERGRWLSHRDCAALVQHIIDAPTIPDNYQCVYAVSDNDGRFLDISNPFGWKPVDRA